MTDTATRRAMGWGERIAVGWLMIVGIAAVFGPWLPLQDPAAQAPCTTKQPQRLTDGTGEPVIRDGRYVLVAQEGCPAQRAADDRPGAVASGRHLLGNDQIGRDMLARLVSGARTSIVVGVGSIVVALVVGGVMGATLAFVGGPIDRIVTALFAGVIAMPAIVLAISIVTGLGRSLGSVWLALTLVATPGVAILARSQALSLVRREYVINAEMLGARRARVLVGEVLPNLLPLAFTYLGLGVALAIAAEGGLAVIGLSVPDPATSWGAMISEGRPFLERYPHISLIPAAVLFATVWSATRLSDAARQRFDIRESLL